MGTIFAIAGISLSVALWTLTGETAAEYVAKYIVDQDDLGASVHTPELDGRAADEPAPLETASIASPSRAAPNPVLLTSANVTPGSGDETEATPRFRDASAVDGIAAVRLGGESSQQTSAKLSGPGIETASTATIPFEGGNDRLLSLIGDTPFRRPDGTVFMPIAAQRVFGFRTVIGERVSVPQTVELAGRVKTNPNTAHLIQTAQDGFVQAPVSGFPFEGQRVKRGEILGYLKPALSTVEQAEYATQVQKLVNEIDLQRKRMARLEEVLMVRYRANRIEQKRIEIDGLRRELNALRTAVEQPIALRAQTDGIVSHIQAAAGQFVHTGATIFEIVDPSRLWVTASAFDPGVRERLIDASAVTVDGESIALSFVGGGLALESQALPMQFEVVDGSDRLSVDQPVTVIVRVEGPAVTGLRVPRASITRTSEGRTMVWERRSAERFVSHHVSPIGVDSEHVLVTSNFGTSARIVTNGVATLAQVQ